MNSDFETLKSTWHSVDQSLFPNFIELQDEITVLRKKQKKRILCWYSAVLIFSVSAIGYVIYTDELNSYYKSFSELILLFLTIFLFRNSWINIRDQNKEFLLNNIEFMKKFGNEKIKKDFNQILIYCLSITLLLISLFLFFVNHFLQNNVFFLIFLAIIILLNCIVWFFIKPVLEKKYRIKHQDLQSKIEKFSKYINN